MNIEIFARKSKGHSKELKQLDSTYLLKVMSWKKQLTQQNLTDSFASHHKELEEIDDQGQKSKK